MDYFIIDGKAWNVGCTINRTSEITPSEVSGLMLDKSYYNDVIGTYLKYDIKLAVPFGREEDYNELYEFLNDPVDKHEFTLPYGNGTVDIVGRIQNVKDVYLRQKNGNKIETHWKGIQFSIIASAPTKSTSLDDAVLLYGFPPLPPDTDVSVGEVYVYGQEGWEELPSGDDNYY